MSSIYHSVFQQYAGNIKTSQPKGEISLFEFIGKTQSGWDITAFFATIRATTDKAARQELKAKLPYFTPAVIVSTHRRKECITRFTGLMQIDLDGMTPEAAPLIKDLIFETIPAIAAAFISPSGNGVKALVKIPVCETLDEYKRYQRAFNLYALIPLGLGQFYDPIMENAVQAMYASFDPNVLSRMTPDRWFLQYEGKDALIKMKPVVNYPKIKATTAGGFLEYIRQRIAAIQAPHHFELRKFCRTIGGKLAHPTWHDYYDNPTEQEIRTAVFDAIAAHPYMGKPNTNYQKNAQLFIDFGKQQPLVPPPYRKP